jgi:hypothetical protein
MQVQSGPSKPPKKDNKVARSIKPSTKVPCNEYSTINSPYMNLDVIGWFNNAKAPVPIVQ